MVGSPWLLLALGAVCASALMLALWLVQLRTRDAGYVDAGWAYGVGGLAVLYAAIGDGGGANRVLVAVLASIWSIRLGTYILVDRVRGCTGWLGA
jgi:steroid 5-alpha reductase family enzyme